MLQGCAGFVPSASALLHPLLNAWESASTRPAKVEKFLDTTDTGSPSTSPAPAAVYGPCAASTTPCRCTACTTASLPPNRVHNPWACRVVWVGGRGRHRRYQRYVLKPYTLAAQKGQHHRHHRMGCSDLPPSCQQQLHVTGHVAGHSCHLNPSSHGPWPMRGK